MNLGEARRGQTARAPPMAVPLSAIDRRSSAVLSGVSAANIGATPTGSTTTKKVTKAAIRVSVIARGHKKKRRDPGAGPDDPLVLKRQLYQCVASLGTKLLVGRNCNIFSGLPV